MDPIDSAPVLSEFLRLEAYQEQTPSTFYNAKPVLYLYSPKSKVVLQGHNAVSNFAGLLGHEGKAANGAHVNGSNSESRDEEQQMTIEAEVYVESTALVLWGASKGVRIEYPSIGIHGVSTLTLDNASHRALYMQLNLYDAETTNSEDDVETADVSIIPGNSSAADAAVPDNSHKTTLSLGADEAVQALYEAVSDCQNLHPDPQEDEDGELGAQQPVLGTAGAPGDGGWVTSENMTQFMDSNGNFVGFGAATGDDSGEAPAVAGTRRNREEGDEGRPDDEEADGETKWQRTG